MKKNVKARTKESMNRRSDAIVLCMALVFFIALGSLAFIVG